MCVRARSPTTVEFDFLGAPHCDKLQSRQTHLLHNTKKDDSHQLLLRPAPAPPSILVCRRAGTLAKCQTDALKFITTGRFATRGHRWYTCALCPACKSRGLVHRLGWPPYRCIRWTLFFFVLEISSLSAERSGLKIRSL